MACKLRSTEGDLVGSLGTSVTSKLLEGIPSEGWPLQIQRFLSERDFRDHLICTPSLQMGKLRPSQAQLAVKGAT